MPPAPLHFFLFLNQLQISSAEKKNTLEKCGNYASPYSKFLAQPLDASHLSTTPRWAESRLVLFPKAQQVDFPACSANCPFTAEGGASSREAVNTNFKVIGLTRLGIKRKSTAPEADALTTPPIAQPRWPANGQASLQFFKTNLCWHITFTVLCIAQI